MDSQYDHCLGELLYRRDSSDLPLDIVAVVSNHAHCAQLVEDRVALVGQRSIVVSQ